MNKRRRSRRLSDRRARLQKLEPRNLMAAGLLGATPLDNGEFLLGTVAVTPVFFESNGQIDPETQNWDAAEIDQQLAKITEGVNWWSTTLDRLGTQHTLDFVIDETFARTPVETGYEPIDRTSGTFQEYVSNFLVDQGYGDSPSLEQAVGLFNHDQRERLNADWSFTLFVVDASDDPNGEFAAGGQFATAFAFPGGLFVVAPSSRPASTIAHEMGHMFWARDEYPGGGSYTDQRGYYNAQNINASDNPAGGQQDSIMSGNDLLLNAYESFTNAASTLEFVGWRDSDNDGIFDLADVPLDLQITGHYDAALESYKVTGTATAVALINKNSSGNQSDITPNEISQINYRIDGGLWQTLTQPNTQTATFSESFTLPNSFNTIEFQAVDIRTGITSPIVAGTQNEHAITQGGIRGFAFLDPSGNRILDGQETVLNNANVRITNADGSELFTGQIAANDIDTETVPPTTENVTLSIEGSRLNNQARVFESDDITGVKVFGAQNTILDRAVKHFDHSTVLVADFDELVGYVDVSAIGSDTGDLDLGSYLRIEAYDANDGLITRTTSELIPPGQSQVVRLEAPNGDIARIRAFGHSSTAVALTALDFGFDTTAMTGQDGAWRFDNLSDGQYQLHLETSNVTHNFAPSTIDVANGTSSLVVGAIQFVDSPFHNSVIAEDVDGNSDVSARDALLVINDLNRNGSRNIAEGEAAAFSFDVNNDGRVSAIDALAVINSFSSRAGAEGEAPGARSAFLPSAIDQAIAGESWTNVDPFQETPSRLFNSAGQTSHNASQKGRQTDTDFAGISDADFAADLSANTANPALNTNILSLCCHQFVANIDPFTSNFTEPYTS